MRIRLIVAPLVVCASLLLASTRADASPIAIGQFFFTNDPATQPLFFTVSNDSSNLLYLDTSLIGGGSFASVHMSLTGTTGLGLYVAEFDFLPDQFGGTSIAEGHSLSSESLDLSDPSLALERASFTLKFEVPSGLTGFLLRVDDLIDFTSGAGVPIFFDGTVTPTPVPEPATLLLLGAGLAGRGIARRWKRRVA